MDYFKTKLTNKELDEGGRCSHLKHFDEKFQIAECCITDLPEGLRASDFPKREFSQKPFWIWRRKRIILIYNLTIFRLQWSNVEWYLWIDFNKWYSNFRQWRMERCFRGKQKHCRLGLWNEQASCSNLLLQGTFSWLT